jgi:hypothetical protein
MTHPMPRSVMADIRTALIAHPCNEHTMRLRAPKQRVKRDRIQQLVQAAGTAGTLVSSVARAVGLSDNACSAHLTVLRREGKVIKRDAPQPHAPRAGRWWAAEHAHAAPPDVPLPPKLTPARNVVLAHDQPTIYPPGLQVQVNETSHDTRYTVQHGDRLTGGFHAEWLRLRGQR